MAEKRMLSKVISISEKVNTLPDIFDMLLYTWLIPHTDDFGRMAGSPAKVKALVVPMLDRSIKDVEQSLGKLHNAGLVIWYEVNKEKFIQIDNFEKHQDGLKRRTVSKIPVPKDNRYLTSNNVLSASESDIEEMLIGCIENNQLINGDRILSTERQLRINNSYIDILSTGESGRRYLFEIKRQRLSNSSIDQIMKYREMTGDSNLSSILVGNGLSSNFDLSKCKNERINVLVYDDQLNFENMLLIDVNCHQITLLTNRSEEKRTEQKGIEENGTELSESLEEVKNRLRILTIECGLKGVGIDGLETIYTYIGQVEPEVIEKAIKKAEKKHVPYFVTIINGWIEEGKTTAESINPVSKVGDRDGNQGDPRGPTSSTDPRPDSLSSRFTKKE
jgi:hypothetical protein